MARVKVCGHTREADVRASVEAGVDAVGVIADVPVETPREVTPDRAATLLDAIPPFVAGVLVTMPDSADTALALAANVSPDVLQIHSGLDDSALRTVANVLDVPLVIGTDVGERRRIETLADIADALLLDSRDESGAGGTGRTHDWTVTREIREAVDIPVILAGGLTPANVAEAVETVDPFAVDVASGVESAGGIKDHEAVKGFVDAASSDRRLSV